MFGAQETVLIINVENCWNVLLNIFGKPEYFFQFFLIKVQTSSFYFKLKLFETM